MGISKSCTVCWYLYLILLNISLPLLTFDNFFWGGYFSIQANSKSIKGNYRGDGLLNGGMLIVTAGGEKVLLSHKQSSPGDHVSNEQILQVLGIASDEPKKEESESTSSGGADCGCAAKEGES